MPKAKKILFTVAKCLVAAGLLGYVLSMATWDDSVTTKDKQKLAVLTTKDKHGREVVSYITDSQNKVVGLNAVAGKLWWKQEKQLALTDLVPITAKDGTPIPDPQTGVRYMYPGVKSSLTDLRWGILSIAMVGFLVSVLVTAVRWWFLLRLQEIHISLWEAIRLTFLGNFFNMFMPSTVGGDAFKAYYIAKHTPRVGAVLVSIFVDRILGMTELTLLAGVSLAVVLAAGLVQFANVKEAAITVGIVVCVVIGGLTFLLSARFRNMLRLEKIYQRLPIAHHFAAAGDAARLYRQRLGALGKAVAITFGAHVLFVGSIGLIGVSLGLDCPFYNYFVYIPLIYIIGAIPLSVGGAGWVEGLYLFYFGSLNPNAVLILALMARFVPMIWALPGAVVAVTGPKLPKADQVRAELEAEEAQEERQTPRTAEG